MKRMLLLFFLTGFFYTSLANHTRGGWMYYKYIGPGSNPNTARYSITLKLYTECILNANQWCPNVNITIFNAGDNTLLETVPVNYSDVQDIQKLHPAGVSPMYGRYTQHLLQNCYFSIYKRPAGDTQWLYYFLSALLPYCQYN